jgi:hypothetical protein
MPKLLVILVVLGFGMIAAATGILAWLNWSPRLYTPVATALLIGVLTGFVSIASTLKPTVVSRSFATAAVVYRDKLAAPIALPKSVAATQRLDLSGLLNQLSADQGPVASADSIINASVEAVQYSLVKLVRELQGGGWASANIGGVTTPIIRNPAPTTLVPIETEVMSAVLTNNRFFHLPSEKLYWQHFKLSTPPGTRIELYHLPSSPTAGLERRGLRLIKPLFFTVDLQIEPLGIDPGLPADVEVGAGERGRAGTLLLKISGSANFERLTAGNQKTDEYKLWVEWLLNELAERLAVGS